MLADQLYDISDVIFQKSGYYIIILILKDNTLKIRCNCFHVFVLKSLLYDDKIKVVSFGILCLLLLKLGKATYGHSVKRLMATPVHILLMSKDAERNFAGRRINQL